MDYTSVRTAGSVLTEVLSVQKASDQRIDIHSRTWSVRSLVSRRHHGGTLPDFTLFVGSHRDLVEESMEDSIDNLADLPNGCYSARSIELI